MTNKEGAEYKNYFANRGVDPEYYKDYKLPKYLLDLIGNQKNIRILDIGCGFGQTLVALKKMGYENLMGVDISEEALCVCHKKGLNVTRIRSIIDFCKNFKNEKFDFIIMSHVLEHIEKNEIIETLRSVRELLLKESAVKGGLCLMVPNAQSNTGCYWAYEDFTHTTLFTAGSLLYVLKLAGFKTIDFLDTEGTENSGGIVRMGVKFFLFFYKLNLKFWNLVTVSSYHRPSPQIFTFEIKVLAR